MLIHCNDSSFYMNNINRDAILPGNLEKHGKP